MRERDEREALYLIYYREKNRIEDEKDSLEKSVRELEEAKLQYTDIFGNIRDFFKETAKHFDEKSFLRELEACEDEFYDFRSQIERELDDKEEYLKKELNRTYREEDELRENLRRQNYSLKDDCQPNTING